MKKGIVLFLAFLLVFSQGFMVSAAPLKVQDVEKPKVELKEELKNAKEEKGYKDTDKVRVVVEVKGEPAITYATKQGKKFSDLDQSKQAELHDKALKAQKNVQQQLSKQAIKMEYKQSFTTVFNGFSGLVEFGKIESIAKLSGVANVTIANEYERPSEKPDMKYSKELVEAQEAWEFGYDGEGMVVGVIDSGADPDHKDFVLTDADKAALTKKDVESDVAKHGLSGKYFNEKVPYGYNYMDENQEVRDLGPGASEHGMHVSGTVVANGDEDNGGLKGVAPEAQLLALKVFGNDPEMGSTYGDIYIKAIDDAIILGADVLNMSLGSPASFSNDGNPESEAITRATENGVIVSVSAGNSAHLGNGFFNPYTSNPDIGVVGAPGLSTDSLQVASFENSFIDLDAVTYSYGDVEGKAAFMSASSVHPNDVEQKTFEIEYAALGGPEDFEGKDFTGKYALVQRGEHAFTDKALNAQAAGAVGVIIYNNTDGLINMATEDTIVIPQLFMLKNDGDLLAEQLQDGVNVTISFLGDETKTANPTSGQMSGFTSWGIMPNLDFKPEITAPGGNILSTLQNDKYGVMSGTSMAAPHVAGGSALVLDRVDDLYDLEGRDRTITAKNIMMNTAKAAVDQSSSGNLDQDIPYSPRRQGAGLMQLHAALTTPVIVTEKDSGLGKVALKEVDDKFSFTLVAENKTDKAVSYDVAANVQTDFALRGIIGDAYLTGELDNLNAQTLVDAKVSVNNGTETLSVPANGSVSFTVEVDLSDAKVYNEEGNGLVAPEEIFENGYFVEGFVTLTSSDDTNPELSVPYVGFKGDWNTPPVLDELVYDGADSFYEQGAAVFSHDGGYYYLGNDPLTGEKKSSLIAISPNTASDQGHIIPVLSYLRNAKTVEYNVLDADNKKLRTFLTEQEVRKNYYDGGSGGAQMYRLNPAVKWDGTVEGKVVKDGQYYVEVKTTIDFDNKEAQSVKIPVIVDTVAPKLDPFMLGTDLFFKASDDGSGLAYFEVLIDGKSEGVVPGTAKSVKLDGVDKNASITVIATDYAGNSNRKVISAKEDKDGPVIAVKSPDAFSIHNTKDIQVSGTVTDGSEIVSFQIEGKDVPLKWDSEAGKYSFDSKVSFKKDGAHPIQVEAKDAAGNTTTLANSRTIFIDTTAPELDVEAPTYVEFGTKQAEITAHVSDNAEELRLLVNGDEVFANEMPGYDMKPYQKTVKTKVDLKPGNNVFELELYDLADNKTTKTVNIYRATLGEDRVDRIEGSSRYKTAVEVSKKGWEKSEVVVLARGDEYADALTGVPLAKKHDAPLLLTQSDKFTQVTKDEITRLGAKTVYLLGGEVAINKDVEKELAKLGVNVKRIAGDNRAETAVKIANEVTKNGKAKEVVLVNGYNFPDALSVASYAADQGLPILVTQDKKLSAATKQAIKDLGASKTLVIGGEVAIDKSIDKQVPNAYRIAGSDRFATAVEIAKHFGVDSNHFYVATGMEFADALSSAALAAKEDTGILLVWDKLPASVSKFVTDSNVDTLTVIGGPLAVSEKIQKALNDLLK